MAYRHTPPPPPEPLHREMAVSATHTEIRLQNGTTNKLAMPEFYVEMRAPREAQPWCEDCNKYMGWPDPRHPDRTLMPPPVRWYIDNNRLYPIHFLEEGYDNVRCVLHGGAPKGLSVDIWFDERQDWIIRMWVTVDMPSAQMTSKTIPFTIFVDNFDAGHNGEPLTQLVQRGHFLITPSIYTENWEDYYTEDEEPEPDENEDEEVAYAE